MKKILALIMTLSIFVLSGCSSQTDRMVTDREGTEVNILTKIEKNNIYSSFKYRSINGIRFRR